MRIRYLLYALIPVIMLGCQNDPIEENQSAKIAHKVDSLLALMTLEEKIGQLNQYSVGEEMTGPGEKKGEAKRRYELLRTGRVGSVLNLTGAENTYLLQKQVVEESRLGIPLIFAYDVIHGYKTIFPIPLGEAASWDPDLARRTAAAAAAEAAASGIQWTFAPMLDIGYDARWGRVMEGAGEDPYLGAVFANARIKGFQGDDLSDQLTIAACAKHFAGYGFGESGKDYNNVNINQFTLFNEILPPFKAAIDGEVATVMTSFNDYEGMPASGNDFLLKEILREQMAFRGLVVSDWNSIGEIVDHRVAKDDREAARMAIMAGTDVDMEADAYFKHLEDLVKSGDIPEAFIDRSVRHVLTLKYALGLFDDPYKYCDTQREKDVIGSDEFINLSREAAAKSIVLLKNDGNLLPLTGKEKLAVIGPLAKDKDSPLGNWRAHGESNSAISLFEGLEAVAEDPSGILFAEGVKLSIGPNNFFEKIQIENTDRSGFQAAINAAKRADKVIMVLGETAFMSGEGRSRADIGLPGLQLELLKAIHVVNPNIVLVLMNGRPMTISWAADNIPGIVEAWHLGSQAGHGIADVLYGKYNPSGKLPMTFPRHLGQIPIRYNYKTTGRPFTGPGMVFYSHHYDVENSPLFPFGHGLSYTSFTYDKISLEKATIKIDEVLKVNVTVTNSGQIMGEEVVQLYIKDEIASRTRPEKELKAFKKVNLAPGESQTITFEIGKEALGFYVDNMTMVVEPGFFEVMVGGSSDTSLSARFELN